MYRQFKKILLSFVSSCLFVTFSYSETPCQNGHSYNNKCDPYYNVNLIEAKIPSSRRIHVRNASASANDGSLTEHSTSKEDRSKYSTNKQKDLTYLDSLRQKYSNQFNGKMGLQALIDRSHYSVLKKNDKKAKKSKDRIVKKADKKKIVKIDKKTNKKKNISKSSIKKLTKLTKKKVIKSKIKKDKLITRVKKGYQTNFYIVKSGDNLIKIAKKYSLKKEVILKINKLDSNHTIKIGQKLLLPISKNSRVKISKNSKQIEKSKKSSKKNSLNKKLYIVKNGDSLSSIAKKIGMPVSKLRLYNKLNKKSKIKVGEKLSLIPSKVKVKRYEIVKNMKLRKTPSYRFKRKIRVVATAYTSHVGQTDKTPFLAAWNNRIRPGMKIIAVSPDLIRRYGLTNGVKVRLLGLPGYYVVRDKMNKRLRNHIDIYMGVNKRRALRWGRKRIVLYW